MLLARAACVMDHRGETCICQGVVAFPVQCWAARTCWHVFCCGVCVCWSAQRLGRIRKRAFFRDKSHSLEASGLKRRGL